MIKKIFYALSFVLFSTACNQNDLQEQIPLTDEVQEICATIKEFEFEKSDFSRTSITIEEDGPHYAWAETDTIGIFPNVGRQVEFSMAEGAGSTSAKFTGGGWGLKSTSTYAAYYPLIGQYYLDKTAIPVDYTGQVQDGNNSTAHLGTYDYLAAPASKVNNGIVSFNFERLGCLVQLKIDLLEKATISNVSVKYEDEALFIGKGYFDLSSENPQIKTEEEKSKVINIKANNLQVASNETAIIYFMMAPVNLEGKSIDIIVTVGNGVRTSRIEGKNFIAGKAYSYNMTMREHVDLGIIGDNGKPLLWAKCNYGAAYEYEYGDYVSWGETTGYMSGKNDFQWSTYKYCNGSQYTMTKYCSNSSYGTIDNLKVLLPSDDVVSVMYGGNWRIPTFNEMEMLRTQCNWQWVPAATNNGFGGKAGYKVYNKNDSSSYIFLPACGHAGRKIDDTKDCFYNGNVGTNGYYMTSTIFETTYGTSDYCPRILGFSSTSRYNNFSSSDGRALGFSIRPVLYTE